jgi:Uma2 family endonuclease
MSLPVRAANRHTYGEYRTWSEQQRYEFIDGATYAIAPAPTKRRHRLVGELFRVISDALHNSGCAVNNTPVDVRLPNADEGDDAIEPPQTDLSVVCDPAKLDNKGCRSAPDCLAEILSLATAGHDDHVRKLALCESHGAREYWLVYPLNRVVTIYRLCKTRR